MTLNPTRPSAPRSLRPVGARLESPAGSRVRHRWVACTLTALATLAAVALPGAAPARSAVTTGAATETPSARLTYSAAADSYADSLAPDKNFGSLADLRSNTDRKYTRIPYLAFPVAGLPAGARPAHAELRLHASATRTFSLRAYQTGAFSESELTWTRRPATGAALGSGGSPVAGRDLVFDVSAAVHGNGMVYLAVRADGPVQGSTYVNSSEATTARPALTVTYDSASVDGGMLLGAAANPHNGRATVADEVAFLDANVGPLDVHRVYDPGFTSDFRVRAGIDVGRRATHYSFKPDLAALAAGGLDGAVRAFLGTIPSGHRTILTIWHEPENDFTTDAQKATYRAAWVRFAGLVRGSGRPELSTSWVMMSYSWRTMAHRQPRDWWPGDGVVDSVGVDTYNEGSLSGARWDSPGRAFGQPFPGDIPYPGGYVDGGILAFVASHHTRLGIAEFGCLENTGGMSSGWTSTPTKADWITKAVDYYAKVGAVYVEYFHSGPYRGPWWLDSSVTSLAAFRAANLKY